MTPVQPPGRRLARPLPVLRLRERFGWWPVARARLDRRSRARFTVRHRAVRARVAIGGEDWTTQLAQIRALKLPR